MVNVRDSDKTLQRQGRTFGTPNFCAPFHRYAATLPAPLYPCQPRPTVSNDPVPAVPGDAGQCNVR